MKKVLCVLLAILLCASGALAAGAIDPEANLYAEGTDVLLKNPGDAYEFYMEQTDGSDQFVFMLLGSQNDEETMTADGEAIVATIYEVSKDGAMDLYWRVFVFQTDYGKAFCEDFGTDSVFAAYTVGEQCCVYQMGVSSLRESGYEEDEFEYVWGTVYYTYDSDTTLNSIRQDEDGTSYYLVSDADGYQYEYKTDSANQIQEKRSYKLDGDDYVLDFIYYFDIREAPTLPARFIDALTEEE